MPMWTEVGDNRVIVHLHDKRDTVIDIGNAGDGKFSVGIGRGGRTFVTNQKLFEVREATVRQTFKHRLSRRRRK